MIFEKISRKSVTGVPTCRSIATKEWNLHPQFLKTNNKAVTGIVIEEAELASLNISEMAGTGTAETSTAM